MSHKEEIDKIIALRTRYRNENNFKAADYIRKTLIDLGIQIQDQRDGITYWRYIGK